MKQYAKHANCIAFEDNSHFCLLIERHRIFKRVYLLLVGIYKLHVELQLLSQLLKCSRPVLVLSVPVLNGLAQRLGNDIYVKCESYCSFESAK